MGSRIYVGNIPFNAGDEQLREAFARWGSVTKVDVVLDRESGRPRGFAFVEMSSPSEAAEAISNLDGTDFGGRRMTVSEAKARSGGGAHQRTDHRRQRDDWS